MDMVSDVRSGGVYVRDTHKRGQYRQYSEDDMDAAALLVHNGQMSYGQAIALYGDALPRATLFSRVQHLQNGTTPGKPGKPTTLDEADEQWLAAWTKLLYRLGVPVTRSRLLRKAKEIAALRGRAFNGTNGLPGLSWWRGFVKRHGLKLAKSSFQARSSAQSLSPEALASFYDLLFSILDEYKIRPELTWGCDETGVNRANGAKKFVVVPAGAKRVKAVGSESAEHVTLLGAVSATGARLPPFLLRKGIGKRKSQNLLEGSPLSSVLVYTRKHAPPCCHMLDMPLACSQGLV